MYIYQQLALVSGQSLDISCPVRIIHGLEDTEINPKQSMKVGDIWVCLNNMILYATVQLAAYAPCVLFSVVFL